MYTRLEQSFTLILTIELTARWWTTSFTILMDANSMPFLPSTKTKARKSVTASSNPSGTTTFNYHRLAESILICLVKIQLLVPLNTVMLILPCMIGACSIPMHSQQHEDWNLFIIWALCPTSFASQPIFAKQCPCKIGMSSILNCSLSKDVWIYKCLKSWTRFWIPSNLAASIFYSQTRLWYSPCLHSNCCEWLLLLGIPTYQLLPFFLCDNPVVLWTTTTTLHSCACQHSFATILLEK